MTGPLYYGPSKHAPVTDLAGALTKCLDEALVATRKAEYEATRGASGGEVATKRIGAGYIGVECGRQLAFKYHKYENRDYSEFVTPGELQRHAEAGHWTEEAVADWLRLAGFNLSTHKIVKSAFGDQIDRDRFGEPKQYGFYAAEDPETGQARIAGEIDGVILAVPEGIDLPLPCLWESKKATDKKWKNFKAKGVAKADPKYHGQVQTCMAYMEVRHTLFTMLNLDNMKFYFELVKFDPLVAQSLTDRAVKVLQSQTPYDLARITTDETDFRCKFCPYTEACWNEPRVGGVSRTPLPRWVNKK
jgi:hypothetical protein